MGIESGGILLNSDSTESEHYIIKSTLCFLVNTFITLSEVSPVYE